MEGFPVSKCVASLKKLKSDSLSADIVDIEKELRKLKDGSSNLSISQIQFKKVELRKKCAQTMIKHELLLPGL